MQEKPQTAQSGDRLSAAGAADGESRALQRVADNIPGGVRVFQKRGSSIVCVSANQYYADMIGVEKERLIGETFGALESRVHPDDVARHRAQTVGELDKNREMQGTYRFYSAKAGGYRWYHLEAKLVRQPGGGELAYFHYTDVDGVKRAESEARASRQRYELAIKGAHLAVWEYDIAAKRLLFPAGAEGQYGRSRYGSAGDVIENVPDAMLPMAVSEEDRKNFLALYDAVAAGQEYATADFWFRTPGEAEPRCERVTYYVAKNSDGRPTTAYGVGADITAQKREQARFEQMFADISRADPHSLVTFRANLTQNRVENLTFRSPFFFGLPAGVSADALLERLGSYLIPASNSAAAPAAESCEALVRQYREGKTGYTVDYEGRAASGEPVRSMTGYIRMMANPYTGDVELFENAVDTTELKIEQSITREIARHEFDYVALIDLDSALLRIKIADSAQNGLVPPDGQPYEKAVESFLAGCPEPGERAKRADELALQRVVHALDAQGTYTVMLTIRLAGEERRKQLKFSYLDAAKSMVLFTRSDITAAFLSEKKNAEQMRIALTAAKQASSAKSNFLSRMSHEIRTPMNAIIGMDTLAAQAIGNDEKVADCISKIGISARYLLSLINDILDMSRIESGKMLLKNEKFLFRDFVANLNTIIYNQAKAKGLDYECTVSSGIAEAYVGDAMKLQQVLINILGNGVKFTQKGKVSLDIHPLSCRGSQSVVRFTVNDTGVGISEEFLAHIFDPFEQADTTSTAIFGGTGLGLAITKSLVELMGGSVRVRSIEGIGSEFMVDVPLTIDESAITPLPNLHFEKMRTLIVDDDLVTCEQTGNILRDIGMAGEWVTSGREAVEKVRWNFGKNAFYDFILIDWKMPDMDGIETTREIRHIVGPDVTIIIVSAYDWETIEAEARGAGANLLVTKPLLRSTLISAFQRARGQEEQPAVHTEEFDFSGRRILVAEDNQINAEIAKSLLESKHFAVELAANGLKAMEQYTQKPAGYYDAILMDIRMPLMDGLQATQNIRHWNKPDAKTIPIIAMTANAFDEDVEKSRAAGMNAHLSKPIEPGALYAMLDRVIVHPND